MPINIIFGSWSSKKEAKKEEQPKKKQGRYQSLMAKFGPTITTYVTVDPAFKRRQAIREEFTYSKEICFARFASYDPTSNGKGKKYAYLQWLCTQYLESRKPGNAPINIDELATIRDNIAFFIELKKRRKHDNFEKDINRHTPSTLAQLREEYTGSERTKSKNQMLRELKAEIRSETEVVFDGPEGLIISPKTMRASQHWGQQTAWCTAYTHSSNAFDNYEKLLIFIPHLDQMNLIDRSKHSRFSARILLRRIFTDAVLYDSRKDYKFQCSRDHRFHDAADAPLNDFPAVLRPLVKAAASNPAIAVTITEHSKLPFDQVPEELRTKAACEREIESRSNIDMLKPTLEKVPDNVWQDTDFCKKVIEKSWQAFPYIPKAMRTAVICRKAAERAATMKDLKAVWRKVPDIVWQDESFCREMVGRDQSATAFMPESMLPRINDMIRRQNAEI